MKVGIGLPNTVPGTDGGEMREWATRAERAGFSTLGTIDRLLYPNLESLIALSYAAAVTERIGLLTSVLLAPLRTNTVLLAKQADSVDRLSGGRLTLGMAPGGRQDDYDASGVDFTDRGAIFDRQLADLREHWDPSKVVIGGRSDAAMRRAAEHGGWMMGGGAPESFPAEIERLRAAWSAAGRGGEPRKLSLGYFALGEGAREQAHSYITDYYAFIGDAAEQMAAGVPSEPQAIDDRVVAFEEAGCDEFIWFPTSSDPEQVDLLAEVVL
jgi:alkanesulfonate monooxygenase SsuD/methylene tetrahydromethanopterin reductase-like flavin-dependent oxidoreductase (luciferase family)